MCQIGGVNVIINGKGHLSQKFLENNFMFFILSINNYEIINNIGATYDGRYN